MELRGPDGAVIKVRLRSLEMLKFFACNAGRVLSKQELMEAVWPGVHVAEDSLFQSIRELRSALGDEQRQIIKLMSGRGYLFVAEVSDTMDRDAPEQPAPPFVPETNNESALGRHRFGMRRRAALLAMAGLGVSALTAALWLPHLLMGSPMTIAVMPMAAGDNPQAARMAADVTRDLTDGLAKIDAIRVVVPSDAAKGADYVVSSELEKAATAWNLRARMTEPATGAVKWTISLSVDLAAADAQRQQTRLTAGMGHALSLRINALQNTDERRAEGVPTGPAKVAIEQATASIDQTTLERFRAAQVILEKALADDADNVDLQVALAAFQLRGIQMAWYPTEERETVETSIGAIMARALRAQPDYIPVLEAHCRYLSTTNRFVESLVACGKVLARDPWDGIALYLIGLSQVFLGRFDDALATFKQADSFDTPPVARWTWAIGAGFTYLLMGRAEEALPWLQRSIAITSASGRTHLLLAAAYQQLGRVAEARATMTKALELRPGSTTLNVPAPTKNTSPVYLKASERIVSLMAAAGLPEK
ncbi:tetratricopeptide repeat protein [Mesorhizobium sp. B292B1B]|uniref:tetratricopeptide repeat protein n=1 Tax=unclassified Mesorhizobium TaxID=325217 RepID=UPI001CD0CD58|nr:MULTISPECIES: tetratricopeptide repeat protein [unclassified Mesorhizobium]MCA0013366.1 tetratricopeptide repeat protein [Mesorhizobium sp. B294B1A1]MCA0039783.1 tetratricopeptide repeat protein [Mesorhizobium sp. B292B1B]